MKKKRTLPFSSTSKERGIMKKVKKHEEEEDKDRLSDLPDYIIHHIFAFLDTRFSVQTCVLSKRWKSLWASSPNIHFDYDAFAERFRLKEFVKEFLSRRDDIPLSRVYLCVNKLKGYSLHSDNIVVRESKKLLAETIINYAASHGIEDLNIGSNYSLVAFLSPVDSSPSLKTLHLSGFEEVSSLSLFDLPMLTTLCLNQCSFRSFRSCRSLWSVCCIDSDPFSSFINLKSLNLIDFDYKNLSYLKISGPQLESLTIDHMHSYSGVASLKFEVFAPKLKSICFRKTVPFEFCNLDIPLLEIANVDVGSPYFKDTKKFEEFRLNLINMLRGLYHAKSLKISSNTIEVLTSWKFRVKDFDTPQLQKFIEYTSKFDELLHY